MPDTRTAEDVEALFDEVRVAEARMNQLRDQMAVVAERRTQLLSQLRESMSVAAISKRLGVSRQAIYASLERPLSSVKRRVHLRTAEFFRSGRENPVV